MSLSAVGAKEDRGAVGAEGVGSMEGVSGVPLPRKFLHFYFIMVSFCACLHGFLFGKHTQMLSNRNRKMFAEQIDKVG